MNTCILGLDSGGSKTQWVLADRQGRVVQWGTSEGLDPVSHPQWREQLRALLATAAGTPLAAAVLGLPLHGELDAVSVEQTDIARLALPCPVTVENDVRIAFDGAFTGAHAGVLILAGTGSMAWASRNEDDAPHLRVGGWGDVFGDEGSAHWIGTQALALASRTLDGRATAARMTQALLTHLALKPDELIDWVYGLSNRRAGVAALAAQVSAWADAGDPDALELLNAAARHLAEHVATAWQRIGGVNAPVWSHAGGVFSHPGIASRMTRLLSAAPLTPRLPPVGGALWRAAHNAGWNPDNNWINTLASHLNHTLALPSTSPYPI